MWYAPVGGGVMTPKPCKVSIDKSQSVSFERKRFSLKTAGNYTPTFRKTMCVNVAKL